jgi:phosphoglucosamine mutase
MALRFGTDGLRGVANVELTDEVALCLGRATARHLRATSFLIGTDTRLSSPMLKAALAAGIASEGIDVVDVGVIPTPGLAWLASSQGVPGAMVSASHNPYVDNGIKLLSALGAKLPDATERAIETDLEELLATTPLEMTDHNSAPEASIGRITDDSYAVEDYIEHLVGTSRAIADAELSVVCDCANGAASNVAPKVFERLGLDVALICAAPDGTNINEQCGSTHPHVVAEAVKARGADLGIAFDGDADRLIAVAEDGSIVDGDRLLALFALDLAERHELANDGVVITVMSNLGLRRRLSDAGIAIIETPVGDRYVADALDANGFVLGGEQSGHIVFRSQATTGDGILTALKLIDLLIRTKAALSVASAEVMSKIPQELRTVAVKDPGRLSESTRIADEVKAIREFLGSSGRVLLRPSGTESAVRVMVEAEDPDDALDLVDRLEALIKRELCEP